MSAWHQERDAKAMPIYDSTSQLATLQPPPPEMRQILGAVQASWTAPRAGVPDRLAHDGSAESVAGWASAG
jgi:hypothetical protein